MFKTILSNFHLEKIFWTLKKKIFSIGLTLKQNALLIEFQKECLNNELL